MKFIPPLSAILTLIGTTVSLQAIPMFEEGGGRARQKSTLVAEQEAQGRRMSESSSAGEASMNQGHFSRQDGSQELQSSSMESTSISSGRAGAATAPPVLTSTEEHLQASAPAATTGGSLGGHSVTAVDPKPISRQWQPYRPFCNDFTASALRYSTIQVLPRQASATSTQRSQPAEGAATGEEATGSTFLPSTEEQVLTTQTSAASTAISQPAAEEAQELQPREQVIALFTQAADRYQQAADDVYPTDQRGGYLLFTTGCCFFRAAEEAQQPQPRRQVIDLLTQSADLFQQAADVFATGDMHKGIVLFRAGRSFIRAAEDAQERQPQQEIINRHVRTAQKNIEKANSSGSCAIS